MGKNITGLLTAGVLFAPLCKEEDLAVGIQSPSAMRMSRVLVRRQHYTSNSPNSSTPIHHYSITKNIYSNPFCIYQSVSFSSLKSSNNIYPLILLYEI